MAVILPEALFQPPFVDIQASEGFIGFSRLCMGEPQAGLTQILPAAVSVHQGNAQFRSRIGETVLSGFPKPCNGSFAVLR